MNAILCDQLNQGLPTFFYLLSPANDFWVYQKKWFFFINSRNSVYFFPSFHFLVYWRKNKLWEEILLFGKLMTSYTSFSKHLKNLRDCKTGHKLHNSPSGLKPRSKSKSSHKWIENQVLSNFVGQSTNVPKTFCGSWHL